MSFLEAPRKLAARLRSSVSPTRNKGPHLSGIDTDDCLLQTQGPEEHSPGSSPFQSTCGDLSGSLKGSRAGRSIRPSKGSFEKVRFADSEPAARAPLALSKDEKDLTQGFVKRFCDTQPVNLKPSLTCDSTNMFTSVHVSVAGARSTIAGDAIYNDGRLFSIFRGHGGGDAAELAKLELSRHFYHCAGRACHCSPADEPTHEYCSCEYAYTHLTQSMPDSRTPLVAVALDKAYKQTQTTIEAQWTAKARQGGTTGLTCWLQRTAPTNSPSTCSSSSTSSEASLSSEGGGGRRRLEERTSLNVYVACCGNAQAAVVDTRTGLVPALPTRTWDDAQDTLYKKGVERELEAITVAHRVTGPLRNVQRGPGDTSTEMQNDESGTGLRESNLLCDIHPALENRKPRAVCDTFGNVSWHILDFEPTRALGHTAKSELHPLRDPEIYEWHLEVPDHHVLLMLGAGFISNHVFKNPNAVAFFLADPAAFCKRPDFFVGTCLEKVVLSRGSPCDAFGRETGRTGGLAINLSHMTRGTMPQLFMGIHETVKDLLDECAMEMNVVALRYLIQFAQQKPVPNVRTAPASTLLAAAYLAVLMLSQETISCSIIMLDGGNFYGGKRLTVGGRPMTRCQTF